MTEQAELLTVPEAAELLGISRSMIYKLMRRNGLRSLKLGRNRRIPRSAIQEFIAENNEHMRHILAPILSVTWYSTEGVRVELTEIRAGVLADVARGLTNQEIARKQYRDIETIRTHVKYLFRVLDARNRAQLVAHAYEVGLLTPGAEDR